jgi:hypothetical protein
LNPGETFYSVLVAEGAEVVRYDYSEEAWDKPPENAIGWWKSQMAEPNAKKVNWAPNDVMLHYFQQLEAQEDKADVRFVLTLLMIRRRVLRLEEAETEPKGREEMLVFCPRNETEYRVPVVTPSRERAQEIQEELVQLLFADAA